MSRRTRLIALVVAAALVVTGTTLWWNFPRQGRFADLRAAIDVIAITSTQYVDPVSTFVLVKAYARDGNIDGMLRDALHDRFTHYFPPDAYRQMQITTSGEFEGIGIMIGQRDDRIVVISPIPGSPGAAAGIRPGDEIVSVDGKPLADKSLDEATQLMRGPVDSVVELGIVRPDGGESKPLVLSIRRAHIDLPSVTDTRVIPSVPGRAQAPVGYIRVSAFTQQTPAQFTASLQKVIAGHAGGLILDLRNNPGGLLSAAVDMAGHFLRSGPVLFVASRERNRHSIDAGGGAPFFSGPVVILVNQNSASASEIVAGALKDRGVAKLVGARTFGKGLVQTIFPLRSGGALSLTTARYLTAGGHDIQTVGIEPDVVAGPQAAGAAGALGEFRSDDPVVQAGLRVLRAELDPAAPTKAA
ncbi:MAG TPA: S41 family peptidase [Limnochordia bacterium]|nr:S41 family peptidase [Limnochordia bacterium]